MSVDKLSAPVEGALKFMTTTEVAALCRTSPESVRWWRHVGRGPKSFRVGRRVLYETNEVWSWLEELKDREALEAGMPRKP
ncbi:hypothetical protein GCM10023258_10210 [Terrabacter aeriphilus]|uniref:Helix-turn-helix domain-containing protein n=1 Tax=Terrabacter aeriphilus TaxID=515662 RepID=A0ABP9J5A0_9MICO